MRPLGFRLFKRQHLSAMSVGGHHGHLRGRETGAKELVVAHAHLTKMVWGPRAEMLNRVPVNNRAVFIVAISHRTHVLTVCTIYCPKRTVCSWTARDMDPQSDTSEYTRGGKTN